MDKTSATVVDYSVSLQIFFLLQAMDVLTTLAGFRMGLVEASPFIQFLMRLGPVAGLLGSKLLAILLGGWCVLRGRYRTIQLVNYWYAALVIWNLALIMTR
jgi:hypothetical protein